MWTDLQTDILEDFSAVAATDRLWDFREATEAFLCLDHVFNDGSFERKQLGIGRGSSVYRHVKKLGFPKDRYQLLCANCNTAKQTRGACPHQTGSPIVETPHQGPIFGQRSPLNAPGSVRHSETALLALDKPFEAR